MLDGENHKTAIIELTRKCSNGAEPQHAISPISVLEYVIFDHFKSKDRESSILDILGMNLPRYAIETFTLI